MIAHKHVSKIIGLFTAAAVCFCLAAAAFAEPHALAAGSAGASMEYESELFDLSRVISVNILMDEDNWSEMLENAASERYYKCDVEINGKTFTGVGIRPKGNTSLASISSDPDTDRFSLKLEFDHYVEGQSCFGLDKLVLNNNYADATNMKEALIYDMFHSLDADASLYNYAVITLNGVYRGVYLALEAVENSFLLRNYGTWDAALYKPDNMEFGAGGKPGDAFMPGGEGGIQAPPFPVSGGAAAGDPENFKTGRIPPDGAEGPQIGAFPGGMPGMQGGSGSSGGADLEYSDDDTDSYSAIWEGEVTETTQADHERVVTALKKISGGTDPETYIDVENVLKYMAVHTFTVNLDSLTGSMAHNYYLYEYGGRLNLIPWDYNLSFGGMSRGGSESASDIVNAPVDTPYSGTKFFNALLTNEEYLGRYHEYLRLLTEEYIAGGKLDETYTRIRGTIDNLVKTDPTAFYTYDQYNIAAGTLLSVMRLRAQSIGGQLAGTIPSTTEKQLEDPSALIGVSGIDPGVMGRMNDSDKGFGGAQDAEVVNGGSGASSPSMGRISPSSDGFDSGQRASGTNESLRIYLICTAFLIAGFLIAFLYRRRRSLGRIRSR